MVDFVDATTASMFTAKEQSLDINTPKSFTPSLFSIDVPCGVR